MNSTNATNSANTATPRLSEAELDAVYTQFCHQMTALGEAQAPLFMARFAWPIPVSVIFPTPRQGAAPTVATVHRPVGCRIP